VLDEILMLHLCGVCWFAACRIFSIVPYRLSTSAFTSLVRGLGTARDFYGGGSRSRYWQPKLMLHLRRPETRKDALLRDVERQFHAPEHAQWALWLDLKARGALVMTGR